MCKSFFLHTERNMPQGRRKVAFSGKAKKQQMQAKKQRQNHLLKVVQNADYDDELSLTDDIEFKRSIQKINKQPQNFRNKYALQFFQESQEELRRRKMEARNTINMIPLKQQEISDNYFPSELDIPKRPFWVYDMSKDQLEIKEQKYFNVYLQTMEKLDISYFELNLETWRQLWRVLEMSDILLIIVDIRFPVLMFPPYLYNYITKELNKDMILILNKIDLAPPPLVVAWKNYFSTHYPKLHILMFTSFPTYNLRGNTNQSEGIKKKRRKGKLKMAAEGAQKLLEACQDIVGEEVDLNSWHDKIQEEMNAEYDLDDIDRKNNIIIEKQDDTYVEHVKYKNGVLTIGCIGTPNVGKSSLMNALMGKKVVSVSRTPGHTKHFQTIYLTKTVCLCDCPGLVFPSTVPKQLQILMGSFPIAQVREPYTSVKFLAERIDLPKLLRIQHQNKDDYWSAMDICDAWAVKRNFYTAKAARPDTYRAANSLLRMSLEGRICIYVYPPNWFENKENWEQHPEVETVKWIQAKIHEEDDDVAGPMKEVYSSSEDEEEEEQKEDEDVKRSDDGISDEEESEDSSSESVVIPVVNNKFEALSHTEL
ncbi:guanine nucleotide-binding protein-like 1 isoform X1 [Vespa mandarinia]|uniref:guanine nucleotide-binding protein-like 1 isoform X1 n=2 Tax=Vespa mandarinia TaxID=7446 RepID=UPI00160B8F86|nr:guanine nucleotide-binding protein-like 1 isoform X1 [Vespa mandarinia]